ncbi:MAG: hypothetical protein V1843_04845, partial [bacterium]
TSNTMMTYLPARLYAGDHELDIQAVDFYGNTAKNKYSFIYKPRRLPFRGNVELYGQSLGTNRSLLWDPYEYYARIDTEAQFGLGVIKTYLYWTTRDKPSSQPYNRFTLRYYAGENMDVNIGDSNPRFSDLTLNGIFLRGADIQCKLSGITLHGIYGDSKRALTSTATSEASFSQKAYGVRGSLDFWGNWVNGINVFRATDDVTSLATYEGISPQDNFIVSVDSAAYFNEGKTVLSGEYAASLYYRDTTASSFEVAGIPSYVTQYFPIRLGMNYDTAYKLKFKTPIGPTKWDISYRSIGPGFVSMGNVALQNDIAEWDIRNSVRLSNFFWQAYYKTSLDNLGGIKETTTAQQQYGANVGYFPINFPAVTLGISSAKAKNDATGTSEVRDYVSDTYSIGLAGIRFNLGSMPMTNSINYTLVSYSDRNPNTTTPSYQNHTYLVNSAVMINPAVNLSTALGWSQRNDQGSSTLVTIFKSVRGRIDYSMEGSRTVFTEGMLVLGENSDNTLSTKRYSAKIGTIWNISRDASINADYEHIRYRDAKDSGNNFMDNNITVKYKQEF